MNLIQKNLFNETLETWHPEFLLAVDRGGEFVGDITENIFKELLNYTCNRLHHNSIISHIA